LCFDDTIVTRLFSVAACPGTQSKTAGKVSACQGCPNQKICASGAPAAPNPGWVLKM